ncbi:hypothetical protein PRZ61_13800 [Halomonas pacifica]|uniref:Uncharacterized protein n=1 Tax=Bisbaumannia pacifica TaxID=77098 RepID=A0A510X8K3_9GAMM|nr:MULTISPECIES: hypothetical protein [Halomonas]MBH8581572.1 hypothetical protein [Halomonas pacifica]MDC8804522.1 hypothetical protein [Halomonas pacifica]GEK47768.1 hypothetical protein HPA02_20510 [Halomonas pacifica]GKW49852.1 hypothetical protein NCCP2165_20670 [Halomonas sp. NCCP-2165]
MHKHVDWDEPGADSVLAHYAKDPNHRAEPASGDILSARLDGLVVRVRVEAHVEATSIGEVVALIDPASGERKKSHGKLALGDTVRLPDDKRAFEPRDEMPD